MEGDALTGPGTAGPVRIIVSNGGGLHGNDPATTTTNGGSVNSLRKCQNSAKRNSSGNCNNNSKRMDGGTRAWLICLSSFLCNGIIFGVINSYSLVFVRLQKALEDAGDPESSSKAGECVRPKCYLEEVPRFHLWTNGWMKNRGLTGARILWVVQRGESKRWRALIEINRNRVLWVRGIKRDLHCKQNEIRSFSAREEIRASEHQPRRPRGLVIQCSAWNGGKSNWGQSGVMIMNCISGPMHATRSD